MFRPEACYSDKLAHVQVVINCLYSVAHLCTTEATLAYNLGALRFDDVMGYNSLTTHNLSLVGTQKLAKSSFGTVNLCHEFEWSSFPMVVIW